MVLEIQSKEVIDKISDELKVQPAMEIPRQLSEKISLVYSVNPSRITNIIKTQGSAASGAATVFTTPTDRDFFLTAGFMTFSCDVAADSNEYIYRVTPFGESTKDIMRILKETLTATSDKQYFSFPEPIKLERGSDILVIQSFTVGNSLIRGNVFGYTTDPQ